MKYFNLALLALSCYLLPLHAQTDPALTLAQILGAKGTLSPAEVARVELASQSSRLVTLAEILKDKGVIDSQDMARLALPVPPAAPPAAAVAATEAPKSAVTTTKGAPVSLYGTVLLTTGMNTANFNVEDQPMIALKQGIDPTGGEKNFYASARQTRLGLNLNPLDTLGGKLSGVFEFDVFGGQAPYPNGINFNLFRLRLAYGRLDWKHFAIEAGQDFSVFAPLSATSVTEFAVPEFAATGNPWIRQPQLRLEAKTANESGNNWLWQFAASDPNTGDSPAVTVVAARQPSIGERGRMPSLQARTAFKKTYHQRDFIVGVSSHYQRAKNAGVLGGLNVQTPLNSWGVAIDYSLPVSRIVTLSGEVYRGSALGIYSVAQGESIGAVGTPGARGVLSRGGWTQLQFNWNKSWQTNLGYGVDQPRVSQLAVGNRSRNQQYMANVIKRLTQNINFSMEYRRILTDFRNEPSANERGDHVDLGLAYIF